MDLITKLHISRLQFTEETLLLYLVWKKTLIFEIVAQIKCNGGMQTEHRFVITGKKNWIRKEKKKKVKFALEVLATTFIFFDRDFEILE